MQKHDPPSFRSERDHRVDPAGAAGGKKTGDDRSRPEEKDRSPEQKRIVGRDLIQL